MRVENKKRFIAFYRKSLKMKFVLVFRCWTLRWYTPAASSMQGRAGVQGRADTLQVHPCKLAVVIHDNRRSAQPCTPARQDASQVLPVKAISNS